MRNSVVLMVVIAIFSILTLSARSSEEIQNQQGVSLNADGSNTAKINAEFLQKLYQSLSDEKKAQIKEKMAQMTQKRLKAIEALEQQIAELKRQKLNLRKFKGKEAQVSQLQTIGQFPI